MVNENIAYARSILNKLDIKPDSSEYSDYLKIREICGQNNGYVGILTKLRFLDGVEDLDELESILYVLKDSKIDINKLNKLSYNEILDLFYDDLVGDKSKDDYELIFKDEYYSYYRVYTYNGILEIGSPSWCLKTKSHWDKYYEKYPEVWVVIYNNYKGKLVTPNSNYFGEYRNDKKPWVRYGISIKDNGGGHLDYVAFSDGNSELDVNIKFFTFFGVFMTIVNIKNDKMSSFDKEFIGCEYFNDLHLKVVDNDKFLKRVFINNEKLIKNDQFNVKESKIYVRFDYNSPTILLVFNNSYFSFFFLYENVDEKFVSKPVKLKVTINIILDYIKESVDLIYSGLKLKNNLIKIEQIKEIPNFIAEIDDWIIFDRNEHFYLVVNKLENIDEVDIPSFNFDKKNQDLDNPLFFYLNKKTLKPVIFNEVSIKEYHLPVIKHFSSQKKEYDKEPKKVKGFFDFLKRKK
jgi:hypothetical protein